MPKRSKDWNESLAEDLKDLEFAAEFVIAAIEEGANLQEALGKVIRGYGVKEYSEISGLPSSNLLRAIDPDHNPTQSTLNQILEPLNLKLSVSPKKSA